MGYTSTEVKRRYNDKTYKRWTVDFRNEEFDKIEAERASLGMSRTEFIRFLLNFYHESNKESSELTALKEELKITEIKEMV